MNVQRINGEEVIKKAMDIINRHEEARRENEYRKWCDQLASRAPGNPRKLKGEFKADIEIQPFRWIQSGLDLIQSRKAFGTIRSFGQDEGPDLSSYLPYPVFQFGTEIFLKGMWLYQFEDCRKADSKTYISPQRRDELSELLKRLSHDLFELVEKLRAINEYSKDAQISEFFKIIWSILEFCYSPVISGRSRWANERYPKRFYDDQLKIAGADAFHSYPKQHLIARLFSEAADQIAIVWRDKSLSRRGTVVRGPNK